MSNVVEVAILQEDMAICKELKAIHKLLERAEERDIRRPQGKPPGVPVHAD